MCVGSVIWLRIKLTASPCQILVQRVPEYTGFFYPCRFKTEKCVRRPGTRFFQGVCMFSRARFCLGVGERRGRVARIAAAQLGIWLQIYDGDKKVIRVQRKARRGSHACNAGNN